MHEALLTRGDVPDPEQQVLIMSQYNCVLVHPGACHQAAATREGQARCITQLLNLYGDLALTQWLDSLREVLPFASVCGRARLARTQ